MDYRVISIGALAQHPLRAVSSAARSSHATTTLVRSGERIILTDPSLPGEILAARLDERSGLKPNDVTHVFCTTFRPDVRRGLGLFEHAQWWISEREREIVGQHLIGQLTEARQSEDRSLSEALETEIRILKRFEPSPDKLASQVDLFPLYGYTPGTAGLLLTLVGQTILICGDAVATLEHLEKGMVLPGCFDLDAARESFAEAVEIADLLVLGRDNIAVNPLRSAIPDPVTGIRPAQWRGMNES